MPEDSGREQRRLMKKFGIVLRLPDHRQWPSEYYNTFTAIQKIGDQKFDSFDTDNIISNERPWRGQIKVEAERFAQRAGRLLGQNRNEAGWRFALENDVLRRFYVEVACYRCRARLWRSEFEAYIDPSEDIRSDLQKRRENRKPCSCPPEYRRIDFHYEPGINPLFEDRVQEIVIHDPLVRSELPNQEPDRVFGLRKTKAFDAVLDTLGAPARATTGPFSSPDIIRCSPFKDCDDPLLFPFLILEAKREKRSEGFVDIQIQTAFPIWALLKLQEDLQNRVSKDTAGGGPLVWFFANRGEYWRVYGCYITREERSKYVRFNFSSADLRAPRHEISSDWEVSINLDIKSVMTLCQKLTTAQEIVQLWDGCITERTKSLQLLLIVDYIVDWARDVYRPSILRQLKSHMASAAYDEVSVCHDSDVLSLRERIANWIPGPPTIVDAHELDQVGVSDPESVTHESVLQIPIPNTALGSLRSASIFDSRIFGLRITEDNVETMLRLAGGMTRSEDKSQRTAREIINFFTRWDELLSVSEEDLDYLECTWTGCTKEDDGASTTSRTATFYVLLEFATFMTHVDGWNIVKEITYLAVSKPALDMLVLKASFRKPPHGMDSIPDKARACGATVWRAAIECLRLGSPWQHFSGAVSCTLVSLYSLPRRMRADYCPPTAALGFGYISRSRLREIIEKLHQLGTKKIAPKHLAIPFGVDMYEWAANQTFKRDVIPQPEELTFIRASKRRQHTSQQHAHNYQLCERCHCVSRNFEDDITFTRVDPPSISEYGMFLVGALDMTSRPRYKHDLCLFAFDILPEATNGIALATVVQDMLQSNHMYHTIRHPFPRTLPRLAEARDTLWNLPMPYRPVTRKLRLDAQNWVLELLGEEPAVESSEANPVDYWNNLQLLLHFLKQGNRWEEACRMTRTELEEGKHRREFFHLLDQQEKEKSKGKELEPGLRWVGNSVMSSISYLGPRLSTRG